MSENDLHAGDLGQVRESMHGWMKAFDFPKLDIEKVIVDGSDAGGSEGG